jgi:hypothetical protein
MSRIRSRQLCLVIFLIASAFGISLSAAAPDYTQGGYADRTSVAQGARIAFSIATASSPFNLQIVNLAQPAQVLATLNNLTSSARDCTGMWETGCNWPVTAQFTVPSNWPSGYYAARFPTSGGTRNVIFVVRAANPGSSSPIVVVSTTNTYQAYDNFGGKALYDEFSTNSQRAHTVSFQRPYFDNAGLGRYPLWEQQFVDWMTAESRSFEVVTDDDMQDPALLAHYKTVVVVGHSEYWTLQARNNLEAFSNAGGHIATFAGNTMWWQARNDLAAHQLTCYKDASLDPQAGQNNAIVTVNWFDEPVLNPENPITGLSFRNGGYANKVADPNVYDTLPDAQRTPYTVTDPASWVYNGTGVTRGQTIAQSTGGLETDGTIFNIDAAGNYLVDGSDGTPLNYDILATLPASDGYAVIGIYTNANGGAVFNAGTRDWSHGLKAGDAVVQQMTRNVLDRFATGQPLPYQARTTTNRIEDLFNTPSPSAGKLPGWNGNLQSAALTAQCAHEGATGLQLSGAHWTELYRSLTPGNTALPSGAVDFYVNADLLQQTASWPIPLVEFESRTKSSQLEIAVVELQILQQGKSIRMSTFGTDGNRSASTAWLPLSAGWQPVRMSWRSPGLVELQVAGQTVQATNPTSGQTVNHVYMQFPGTDFQATGSICLDELRVNDANPAPGAPDNTPPTINITDGGTATANGFTFAGTASDNRAVTHVTYALSGATSGSGNATGTNSWSTTLRLNVGRTTVTFTACDPTGNCTSASVIVALTSTTLTTSANPSPYGSPLTLTATVSGGAAFTGTITFFDGSASLGTSSVNASGTATLVTANLGVGTHALSAQYSNDSAQRASTSSVINETIGKAVTSTSIASSASRSVFSRPVTFIATVTSSAQTPTGTVTFIDGGTTIGSAPLSGGSASLTVSNFGSGLHEISASFSGGDSLAGSVSAAAAVLIRTGKSDFTGDGKSDVVLQNANTATVAAWQMNGATLVRGAQVSTPAASWKVVATGDLDGDNNADIILQNVSSGAIAMWRMNGLAMISGSPIATMGTNWRVVGTYDFNHDGKADIVLQNSSTGEVDEWQMNGSTIIASGVLATPLNTWRAVAAAYINGDSIVLQNNSNGAVARWSIDGLTMTAGSVIGSAPAARLIGAGDFTADGIDDLLFQNPSTRGVAIWTLAADGTVATAKPIATPANPVIVLGAADYDGDGRADILLQTESTNQISMWQTDGTTLLSGKPVTTPVAGWTPIVN